MFLCLDSQSYRDAKWGHNIHNIGRTVSASTIAVVVLVLVERVVTGEGDGAVNYH